VTVKAPSTSNGVHVIYETPEGTRYLNTEAFSADGVNTFVSKVLKGEVPKFVKSEVACVCQYSSSLVGD